MTILVARGVALAGRLQPTDLTLEAGTVACLIGPNGSGKTSLLHALAGIGRPQGEVRIGGIDPATAQPAQRRRLLSFLPASRDIQWPLSAADVIALGGDCLDSEQLLADLDLTGLAGRRVDRLSTGERSRVLIARALAPRPRLLLLDEPAANLDPLWQLKLMDYLRALARSSGQAVLLAVHDLDVAAIYADRLLIMDHGRVAADGDPQRLLAGPDIPRIFGIERRGNGWRPI